MNLCLEEQAFTFNTYTPKTFFCFIVTFEIHQELYIFANFKVFNLLTKGVFLKISDCCVGGVDPQMTHSVKHLVLGCICLSHCVP